jgi:DNA-binding MarR family transcriptional regulator
MHSAVCRVNSFSRNPSAFAEFQATTRGTASQAIKALEVDGHLVRQRSKADRRSVSLRLTNKGKKALARDPFEVLVRAVDSLEAKQRATMRRALHQVLTTVAVCGPHRHFGICQDCAHFGRETGGNVPSTFPLGRENVSIRHRRACRRTQGIVKFHRPTAGCPYR